MTEAAEVPGDLVNTVADAMEQAAISINARSGPVSMPRMYRYEREEIARFVLNAILPAIRAAAAREERERAAQIAFDQTTDHPEANGTWNDACEQCARAIREASKPRRTFAQPTSSRQDRACSDRGCRVKINACPTSQRVQNAQG